MIEDWEFILRSPMNKKKYKKLFVDVVIQIADKYMKSGQAMYMNGTFEIEQEKILKISEDYDYKHWKNGI